MGRQHWGVVLVTLATIALPGIGTRVRSTVGAYVALTKPRIIELLLVTTLPALVLAARGLPGAGTAVATMVGGSLSAAGANVLNCYLDRDIDALMPRTRRRPLAAGAVPPRAALAFGLVLSVSSVALFLAATNALAAVLAGLAIVMYVVGYTVLLKRRTPQNIVWGGAAGCMPVLIGWAAVTGSLSWTPVVLFAVIFLWTPPHFWALAFKYRADYQAAGVPMLPVVAAPGLVATRIVAYSWAMVAVSLLLVPVAHLSVGYLVASVLLGGVFLREAHLLRRRVRAGADPRPARLFHWSITYLSLLSLAAVLDVLIAGKF